jgi:putative inorganic carbon (HCO3(-)) transporter
MIGHVLDFKTAMVLLLFLGAFLAGMFLVRSGYRLTMFFLIGGGALLLGLINFKAFFYIYVLIKPILNYFFQLPEAIQMEHRSTLGLDGILNVVFILCAMAYFTLHLVNKKWSHKSRSPFLKRILILFGLLAALSLLVAPERIYALRGLLRNLGFIAVIFTTASIFTAEKDIRRLINFWLLSSLIPLIVGFRQFFWGSEIESTRVVGFGITLTQVSSTFGSHVFWGIYLSFIFTIILSQLLYKKRPKFILYGLILLFALITTVSRNSWIIALTSSIFMLFMKKKYIIITIVVISAVIFSLKFPVIHDPFANYDFERVLSGKTTSSLEDRTKIWLRAMRDLFPKTLILGLGPEYFPIAFGEHTGRYVGPHNTYLKILIENGLPAMILYVLLLYLIFRTGIFAYKKLHSAYLQSLSLAMSASLLAIIIGGMADNMLNIAMYFWSGMIIGLITTLSKFVENEGDIRSTPSPRPATF